MISQTLKMLRYTYIVSLVLRFDTSRLHTMWMTGIKPLFDELSGTVTSGVDGKDRSVERDIMEQRERENTEK